VAVRYLSQTAVSDWFVDNAVILDPDQEQYDMILGDGTEIDTDHVEGVFFQQRGYSAEVSDSYAAYQRMFQPWNWSKGPRSYIHGAPFRLEVARGSYRPLWVRFRQKEAEMTGLTSSTIAPPDVVVYGTVAELMERQARTLPLDLQRARLSEAARIRQAYYAALPQDIKRPHTRIPTTRVAIPPAV
jgi:hypothetical protein